MRKVVYAILGFASATGSAGCSSPNPTGVPPDLAASPPDLSMLAPPRQYTSTRLDDVGQAGFQTAIAVGPSSTVGLATLAATGATSTCMLENRASDVFTYDVWFAESKAGASFTATRISTEKYLSLTGVGLAYSKTGEAAIAWTGNAAGVPAAQFRCGASDLLLATRNGGAFSSPKAVATSSQAATLVPDQVTACIQNVCNLGDATGYWPSVAYGPSGAPALAFRDLHYGFADSDFSSADLEYAAGPAYSIVTVDVARGGGTYARLAFTPSGDPAILHYNGEREVTADGVWLNRVDAGAWKAARISPARVGESLGFAISDGGLFAIAYYDEDAAVLKYMESANGVDWSTPQSVDSDGVTGKYPSLAFGPDGEPAIAYYRCRDYDPTDRSCDPARDGLLVARRAGGRWSVEGVSAVDGIFDGVFPALAFVEGKAVIAYQSKAYDPRTMTSTFELRVAREQ